MSNVSQSAYKQFHSTVIALLKVHNDATQDIDKGKVTALTLLDVLILLTITYSFNACQCGMA